MKKRIALIHATPVAIGPVLDAFARLWSEAECVNLLDDSLSRDREGHRSLTPALTRRIADLAAYALAIGADAILFTCSAFGEAIEAAATTIPVPVLKPNEAMFELAIARGDRVGMLATFPPSVSSMEGEFASLAQSRGRSARITTICVPEAMDALRAGMEEKHNSLLARAAPQLAECDVLMLAHFSTARAESAVSAAVTVPVLTSPGAAVSRLKQLANARPEA